MKSETMNMKLYSYISVEYSFSFSATDDVDKCDTECIERKRFYRGRIRTNTELSSTVVRSKLLFISSSTFQFHLFLLIN